jgi:hypothetical protein
MADPAGLWPMWQPEVMGGTFNEASAWACVTPHGAATQPWGPIEGAPVRWPEDSHSSACSFHGGRPLGGHPHLQGVNRAVVVVGPDGVAVRAGHDMPTPGPHRLWRPVFALPWRYIDVLSVSGRDRTYEIGIHTPAWSCWFLGERATAREAAKSIRNLIRSTPLDVMQAKIVTEAPASLRNVRTPAPEELPYATLAYDPGGESVPALVGRFEQDLAVDASRATDPTPRVSQAPRHKFGGWRCWWGRYLVHLSLNEKGIRVLFSKDNSEVLWPWEEIRSLQVGDASRATVTRVAAVGIAGIGIRKSQTTLAFVAEGEQGRSFMTFTLQYVSEPEVAAALEALSQHEPRVLELLRGQGQFDRQSTLTTTAPPAPLPTDASTRLRQLAGLLSEGLISEAEYDQKRSDILTEL